MVTFGIDAHKRTHTIVAIDDAGRHLGEMTTTATRTKDHLKILRWAAEFGGERRFAVEDCRHLSRRLESDMLAAGEQIVRVPPKMMAKCRASSRTYGKSDPIDALAVARAALREPDLPTARLDGPEREVRLLVDHRDHLVAENTRHINRLRWHLHDLDPAWDPKPRGLRSMRRLKDIASRLEGFDTLNARIAGELVAQIISLTTRAKELEAEISELVSPLAPTLLELDGVGALTAGKILGEVAGIDRFKSKDAFAKHNGTAPIPVSSGNRERHRLSRHGNRDLNCTLHRIALTQIRVNEQAKAFIARRLAMGNTFKEALRALKRRLSDVVYRSLITDHALQNHNAHPHQPLAA